MGKCNSKPLKRNLNLESSAGLKPQEIPNAKEIKNVPNNATREMIKEAIKQHYLFQGIKDKILDSMISKIKFYIVPESEIIISQGDVGNYFYIMNTGYAEVWVDDVKKNVIARGECFGEISLITATARTATIKSIEKCTLWAFPIKAIKYAMDSIFNDNFEAIVQMIYKLPIFCELKESVKQKIISEAILETYQDNRIITDKGDPGLFIYIVMTGSVMITIKGKNKGNLGPEQVFGESALLVDNYIRSATIISYGRVQLICIPTSKVKVFVGPDYKKIFSENIIVNTMALDPIGKNFAYEDIKKIAKLCTLKTIKQGEIAIPGKRLDQYYYVICLGKLISQNKVFFTYQFIGFDNANQEVFGEEEYKVESETILAEVSVLDIEKNTGLDMSSLIKTSKSINYLSTIELFSSLSTRVLSLLNAILKTKSFEVNEIIYAEGDVANFLCIVREGTVSISEHGKEISIVSRNEIIGEACIIDGYRKTEAKAITKVSCFTFSKNKVLEILQNKLNRQVLKQKLFENQISLETLNITSEVTTTDFREFCLATCSATKQTYTTEIIYKSKINDIIEFNQLIDQKRAQVRINYPQIPRFFRSFTSDSCVYFIYEYFPHELLSNCKTSLITESGVRFIIMSLNNILVYLSKSQIMHRNICPENILIDDTGYIYLDNFKYAKILKDRTYTIVGNPKYHSKEIILQRGYGLASEYWSLGVLMFELLTGNFPFGITEKDNYEDLCRKIMNNQLVVPENISGPAGEVLKGLLNENVAERFGSDKLKASDWAQVCNFQEIQHKIVRSPLKVNVATRKVPKLPRSLLQPSQKSRELLRSESAKGPDWDWSAYF